MAAMENDGAVSRFTGFIDDFVSGRLFGWAVDRERPEHDACVAVFAGERLVGVCRADVARPDLVSLMPGEGRHGFECSLMGEIPHTARLEAFAVTAEVYRSLTSAEWPALEGSGPLAWRTFQSAFPGCYGKLSDRNEDSLGLRDLGAGLGGAPAPGDLGGSPRILIEITDLMAFHRVHVRVTGIQRVLCGLIAFLSTMQDADDVAFCLIGQRPGIVNILDKGLLSRLVSILLGGDVNRENLDESLRALEAGAHPEEPRNADVVLIAGAFWIYDRLDRHLPRLRDRGTCLGLLVHDLIPITHPNLVSGSTRRAFTAPAIGALPQFDFFVTTSAFVARQTLSVLANEVGRVPAISTIALPHRTMPGLSDAPPGARTARRVPPPCSMDGPFVLCVSTIEVRKNHMLLYWVWAALLRKYGGEAVPRLILVGRWGWDVDEFRQALKASDNLDGRIVILSDVSDEAVAELYSRCLFTVFPSFAEGWGLPVGESLAAGKLCVASRATAIPEVGGEFCSYFDPYDVLEAFAAIEQPILDRRWLSDREVAIAGAFRPRDWAATSSDVLKCLRVMQATFRTGGLEGDQRRGLVFKASDIIDLTGGSQNDDSAPWRFKGAETVLATGWHPCGSRGARPSMRTSTIALTTDLEPGTDVTVLLRLEGTERDRSCCLQVDAGRGTATATLIGQRPRWSEVQAVVGSAGVLRLAITGLSESLFIPTESEAGFALLSIAMLKDDTPQGHTAVYRKIISLH